ncbi:MAG: hypothetical protein IPO67_19000 [Deltaproteobacteria bacterium]|nr:hypothetical protein [Deltaproteobacteria bacterium]
MPQEARDAAMAFKVAGRVEPRLAISLLALTVRERRDGLASLSATFGALGTPSGEPDLDLMDRKLLDYGAELEVQHQDTVVFKGKITCLSAQFSKSELPSLTVLAEDACQDLRMTRRTRVFVDVTDADLARRIGQEHGLDVRVDADDGPTWPQLAQLSESDLAFLRRRALSAGLDLWVSDGRLNLRARPVERHAHHAQSCVRSALRRDSGGLGAPAHQRQGRRLERGRQGRRDVRGDGQRAGLGDPRRRVGSLNLTAKVRRAARDPRPHPRWFRRGHPRRGRGADADLGPALRRGRRRHPGRSPHPRGSAGRSSGRLFAL